MWSQTNPHDDHQKKTFSAWILRGIHETGLAYNDWSRALKFFRGEGQSFLFLIILMQGYLDIWKFFLFIKCTFSKICFYLFPHKATKNKKHLQEKVGKVVWIIRCLDSSLFIAYLCWASKLWKKTIKVGPSCWNGWLKGHNELYGYLVILLV